MTPMDPGHWMPVPFASLRRQSIQGREASKCIPEDRDVGLDRHEREALLHPPREVARVADEDPGGLPGRTRGGDDAIEHRFELGVGRFYRSA